MERHGNLGGRVIPSTSILGLEVPLTFEKHKDLTTFTTKFKGEVVTIKGGFFDYMSYLRARPQANGNAGGKVSAANALSFNKHVYGDDQNDFVGGTYQDLVSPHTDFAAYNEALKTLSQNKIWKNAAHSFSEITVRKRTRCAYDGEFDYDKRWDAEPFQRRSPRPNITRIVKLHIEGAFSCMISAEQIQRFGGFCAAIAQLLERNGVMVEISIGYTTQNPYADSRGGEVLHSTLMVKRADEYLPPGQVMKALSPVFYRRAGFGLMILGPEFAGKEHSYGLGNCYGYGKQWSTEGNRINIYAVPSVAEQEKIVEGLIEMIGKQAAEAVKGKAV